MKTKHLFTMAVLLLATLLPDHSMAQKAGDWTIGLAFQPCLYWKYNQSDWNNRPLSYVEQPNKFNGYAGGISVGHFFTNQLGIGAELTYSKQWQQYNTLGATETTTAGQEIYHYILGSKTQLDYLKLPIFATFHLEIGYESGFFLQLLAGPQCSLNTNYHGEYVKYEWDAQNEKFLYDVIRVKDIITPFHYQNDFLEFDGTHTIAELDTKYLYRRFELGVLGGITLQKRIFQSCLVSLGARYELGLTDIENPKEDKSFVTSGGITGSDGLPDPRPATHNRRLVLDIGISRIIE